LVTFLLIFVLDKKRIEQTKNREKFEITLIWSF